MIGLGDERLKCGKSGNREGRLRWVRLVVCLDKNNRNWQNAQHGQANQAHDQAFQFQSNATTLKRIC